MAQRDLIVSFLGLPPTWSLSGFKKKPLVVQCPVTQAGGGGYPGGRDGYRLWLQQKSQPDPNEPGKKVVIPGLFSAAGAQSGDTIGRVAICGFSNGCIGVDETLYYNDAFQIDSVIAIDGIQGQWADPVQKTLYLPGYKNWFNFGVHVLEADAENDPTAPCMVVTHSSIIPGNSPSTTDTAYYIWNKVRGKAIQKGLDVQPHWKTLDRLQRLDGIAVPWLGPCTTPFKDPITHLPLTSCEHPPIIWNMFNEGWYERNSIGNFNVWGWGDLIDGLTTTRDRKCGGPCDHIFQGRAVFQVVLDEFLVNRWNAVCNDVSGFGVTPMQPLVCEPGEGTCYGEGKSKQDFFDEIPNSGSGGGTTVPAPVCPNTPPGYTLSPLPGKPCNLEPNRTTAPLVTVPETKILTAENMFAFASGAALGYLGYRYVTKRMR